MLIKKMNRGLNPPRPLASRRVDPNRRLQVNQRLGRYPNPTLPQPLARLVVPGLELLGRLLEHPRTLQKASQFRIDFSLVCSPIVALKMVPQIFKNHPKSVSEHGPFQTLVFETILSSKKSKSDGAVPQKHGFRIEDIAKIKISIIQAILQKSLK